MSHETQRQTFIDLIDAEAPVSQVATGFIFTEGPVWHPLDHYLLFSDMPGDVRRRWDPEHGVVEVKRPANKCNGMTYDADLNLIVCEHATSLLVRERPDGRREVLASHFQGKELNSPNDVCVRSDGSIYFTDPIYGRSPHYGVERPHELGFQGVYRVPSAGGAPQLLVDDDLFNQPNGLCFSPDEKLLYVNDSARKLIRVFDVSARRLACQRAHVRLWDRLVDGARRTRRHEMRRARQCVGHRPGGLMGLRALGRPDRKTARAGAGRQPRLGRRGFQDPVPHREQLRLQADNQGRPAPRALHERGRFRRRGRVAGRLARAGPYPRPEALRPPDSGHAERRGQRGRRLRRVRRARSCAGAERGREHTPGGSGRARQRRAGDPCLVHRRARRDRREAQRAAVQGPRRA